MNFFDPSKLGSTDKTLSTIVVRSPATEGVEFVRTWDRNAISVISMMPFLLSLVFAALWVGIFVGKYHVDTQVAVQTAFTVAAFIVTAGKSGLIWKSSLKVEANTAAGALLIALFAFLDTQTAA